MNWVQITWWFLSTTVFTLLAQNNYLPGQIIDRNYTLPSMQHHVHNLVNPLCSTLPPPPQIWAFPLKLVPLLIQCSATSLYVNLKGNFRITTSLVCTMSAYLFSLFVLMPFHFIVLSNVTRARSPVSVWLTDQISARQDAFSGWVSMLGSRLWSIPKRLNKICEVTRHAV